MKAVPRNRYIAFVAIAAIGCFVDLVTKQWIFAQMGMPFDQPSHWLVPEIFGFTISLNEGALFGIGQGQVPLFARYRLWPPWGFCTGCSWPAPLRTGC